MPATLRRLIHPAICKSQRGSRSRLHVRTVSEASNPTAILACGDRHDFDCAMQLDEGLRLPESDWCPECRAALERYAGVCSP